LLSEVPLYTHGPSLQLDTAPLSTDQPREFFGVHVDFLLATLSGAGFTCVHLLWDHGCGYLGSKGTYGGKVMRRPK